jgi:hypothetical protein
MKDDVKDKVPNKTPKTLIPSNGVLKSSNKLEGGDHAFLKLNGKTYCTKFVLEMFIGR